MNAVLVTPPTVEPVSLDDAKQHLRVEHDDDDALISDLVTAARIHVEASTRRALITQTWRHYLDDRPQGGQLVLSPSPVRSVTSVTVHDGDGLTSLVDPTGYVVDIVSVPCRLRFRAGAVLFPRRELNGIEIEYVAGYGDTADDVPMPLRQAIRRFVNHWYEHREAIGEGGAPGSSSGALEALVARFRVPAL